ncbi:hypothetical protein BEWA_004760 [Theileria equi strain WA]|uniref:Uncharacterized protein n=1 Tax=Theileria equi strain WA TaxID=1537102 RepID=L0B0N3_THEEQ|nr:hypothetical protein BEWA_004760 [Theileria equi strain WA]AFZ81068.1 hypothetical protein BEWA_004760 [Theileria equi strain WA]|eukprot:XP_004830734.1 hypothetical protein BEWA_004760 [Theileria equi strain WA]
MIANQETKSLPSQIILLANIIDGLPHDASLKSLVKNKWRQSSYSPLRSSTPVSCNEKEFTQFDCFTVPHYYETVNTPEYGVSLDFPADLTPNEPFLTEENYLIPNYSEKDTTKTTFAKSDRNKQCANELLNGTLGNATDSKTSSTPSQKDTESTEKGQEKEFVSIKDLNIDLIGSVFPKGSIIFINNLSREKAKFANFEQRNVTCSTDVSKSKNLTVPESNYCSKQEHDAILFNLESLQIKYNALFCFVNRFEEHTKFSCDQLERFIGKLHLLNTIYLQKLKNIVFS